MSKTIASTAFNAAVVLIATAAVVWLTITGHAFQIGGLLLAMAAILAAVMFGFRLTEGFGSDRLSIWAGPVRSVRLAAPGIGENGDALRKAA
jgi:hypothetical protein